LFVAEKSGSYNKEKGKTMSNLIRTISSDGSLFMMAADTTNIVSEAQKIHHTTKVCTAALGRLLTVATFMGHMLKGEDASVTLRINGGGPAGSVIAVGDSSGNVRGYIQNGDTDMPLNEKGKLDVGGAIGKDGFLTVIKDLGVGEPYVGQVPIVSGEIAEDITSYYATSEQTPTVCALGVLVNRDKSVACAGGFLIQLLPTADEEMISAVERSIEKIEPITTMLAKNMSLEEICRTVLSEIEIEVIGEYDIEYRCNCNRERVEKALLTSGREALLEMAEDPVTEVSCHFCNKKYKFSPEEVRKLADSK
jgi:molecular chaperone Hsp33